MSVLLPGRPWCSPVAPSLRGSHWARGGSGEPGVPGEESTRVVEVGVNPAAGEKLCIFLTQADREKLNEAFMEKKMNLLLPKTKASCVSPPAYVFV